MKNPNMLVATLALVACVSSLGALAVVIHELAGEESDMLSRFDSADDVRAFMRERSGAQDQRWNSYRESERNPSYGGDDEPSYSGTNVQVAGVDEEDIVKTDGTYVYISSYTRVTIVRAYPPSEMHNVSVIEAKDVLGEGQGNLSVQLNGLYVSNGKLVILATAYEVNPRDIIISPVEGNSLSNHGPRSFVVAYDISEPSDPRAILQFGVSGHELTSRMIGSVVFLVAQSDAWYGDEPVLPSTWTGNSHHELSASVIRYDPDTTGASGYVNFLAVDLETSTQNLLSVVIGHASTFYMSPSSMYLTVTKWSVPWLILDESQEQLAETTRTTIYRITLNGIEMAATARGDVHGWLMNQFAMDESGDYLRVATSAGWGENDGSNVYVLAHDLSIVGALKGIAPGERITSSRFVGDTLYLVTFRQVDPLFVIDLSRPTSPTVIGELEAPGFSSYLHPVDKTHLIGIGTENSTLKVSLYDVSDPTDPTEISKYLAPSYSYSDAQWNHKAVLFDPERELLVIPVYCYAYSYNGSFDSQQGALVLRVSVQDGISPRGVIEHSEWPGWYWSGAVQRSFYIGAYLYTVSQYDLKASNMTDLSEEGSLAYYVPDWVSSDVWYGERASS